MPRWDGVAVWDGSKTWGFDDAPLEVQQQRTLWGPDIGVRAACFEIVSVDEVTWVWGDPLPLLVQGGRREIGLMDNVWQRESIEFMVNDPTGRYVPGGDLTNIVAPGKLVGLRWTVRGGGVSQTYQSNVFRIKAYPSNRTRNSLTIDNFTLQGEDWLLAKLRQPALVPGIVGVSPLIVAVLLKEQMLALGSPVIEHPNSWATVAAALLFYVANQRVRVTGAWSSPQHPPIVDMFEGNNFVDPLATHVGAQFPSWLTVLNWLLWYSDALALYDPDGYVNLRQASTPVDSGLILTCNEAEIGLFNIPAEQVVRNVNVPEFAAIHLLNRREVNTPGGVGGPPVTIMIVPIASFFSPARDNPYVAGISPDRVLIDNALTPARVYTMLMAALGRADAMTVQCDSAFPAHLYFLQTIRVNLPPIAQAWYRVTRIQQPFTADAMSIVMEWVGDS